jgi:hypothetical protein
MALVVRVVPALRFAWRLPDAHSRYLVACWAGTGQLLLLPFALRARARDSIARFDHEFANHGVLWSCKTVDARLRASSILFLSPILICTPFVAAAAASRAS